MADASLSQSSSGRTCLFITDDGDEMHLGRRAEGLLKGAIVPAVRPYGIRVITWKTDPHLGSRTTYLKHNCSSAKLVIADITDLGPDVFYALALCHAAETPAFIVAAQGTRIPSSLGDQQIVFFRDDIAGLTRFRASLDHAIRTVTVESRSSPATAEAVEGPITSWKTRPPPQMTHCRPENAVPLSLPGFCISNIAFSLVGDGDELNRFLDRLSLNLPNGTATIKHGRTGVTTVRIKLRKPVPRMQVQTALDTTSAATRIPYWSV